MLSKNTPKHIKGDLTITGMGVEARLLLTYYNRHPDEFAEFVKNEENLKVPELYAGNENKAFAFINAQICLFLVASFDDGTDADFPLTVEGLMALDEYWQNGLNSIIRGYHKARAVDVEKNSVRR